MESQHIKEILVDINFPNCYEAIARSHSGNKSGIANFNPKILLTRCQVASIDARYFGKENYFQSQVSDQNTKVCVNYKLAPTSVVLILAIYINDQYQDLRVGSGSWGDICKFLVDSEISVDRPRFNSYDEVVEIIGESLELAKRILAKLTSRRDKT